MSLGNDKTSASKGNNFPFQFNVVKLLQGIKDALTGGITVTSSENLAKVNNQTVDVGTGAAGTGTQRVSVSTDSVVRTKEIPDDTSTFSPSQDVSAALEASSVSKASAGVFYGLSGYNSLASAQFILIFNSATVPADGAVTPIAVISVAASSNFSFDTGKFGMYCSTGISWCNSTNASPFTKAVGAANCFVNLVYK